MALADVLRSLASVLQELGFLLYGGPMVAFAVLVNLAPRIAGLRPWEVVRSYRAWGAGLGLSLGTCVLGALGARWLDHGEFSWSWNTPTEQLALAWWVTFFAMWVSNIKLEVWTLEPLRKLDGEGGVKDETAYDEARRRLGRHMALQALLVLAVAALGAVS